MKTLCVLLGANLGLKSEYLKATKQLAESIARKNIRLIYGGGRFGLMGVLADTVIKNGGKVTGVITHDLYNIEAHLGLSELHKVETMQMRKRTMIEKSDGFIVLPGGLGTLEEFFEIWNAAKLKIHQKPIGLLNTENYYDKLIEFISYSSEQNFLKPEHRSLIQTDESPINLLEKIIQKSNEGLNDDVQGLL